MNVEKAVLWAAWLVIKVPIQGEWVRSMFVKK